ncbi:helix-turn-helix domain-containing protein [Priestia megaterium]
MPLKSRWRIILAEKEITQNQLAEKLDVTPQQLSNWIRMKPVPRIEIAFKVAKTLGVTVDELFDYIEEEKE